MSTIVQNLRDLADFLEVRPEIAENISGSTTFNMFVYSREDMALAARAFGKADKVIVGSFMCLRRTFGTIRIDVNVQRDQVCRKVVTGTKVIPATILPAREETIVPETTEEIFEWKCDPILGEQPKAVIA